MTSVEGQIGNDKEPLVWYVAYGSSLLMERFKCYLEGRAFKKLPNARIPKKCEAGALIQGDEPFGLRFKLYFAHDSEIWGHGVSFVWEREVTSSYQTFGRAYLITLPQLICIAREQNGGLPVNINSEMLDGQIGMSHVITNSRKGWYRVLLLCGRLRDIPVVTLTGPEMASTDPSENHLQAIREGIHETYEGKVPDSDIDIYLKKAKLPLKGPARDALKLDIDKYFRSDDLTSKKLSTYIESDMWTTEDTLDYRPYAHAIARFLTHHNTKPPLCVSIQSPWGGGKSSLMRMVREEIDKFPPDKSLDQILESQVNGTGGQTKLKLSQVIGKPEDIEKEDELGFHLTITSDIKDDVKPRLTVWFNAWEYQSSEQVWDGLAGRIIEEVAARLEPKECVKFLLQLHKRRHGSDRISRRIYDRISFYSREKTRTWKWGSIIAFAASSIIAVIGKMGENKLIPLVGLSGIVTSISLGVGVTALQSYLAKSQVTNESVKGTLGEYANKPNYDKKSNIIGDVIEDIRIVLKRIPAQYLPIIIFIDDLDRCSPNKVADVVEALNFFIGGNFFRECLFVIGMDPLMVAAALEEAYGKIISKLPPDYSTRLPVGWRFMEKFVQLSFPIPSPKEENVNFYIKNLFVEKSFDDGSFSSPVENKPYQETKTQTGDLRDEFLAYKEEQKKKIKNLNKIINDFSEDDPVIRDQILKAAVEFSNNPRDLKRFVSMYRFHYFLRAARISNNQRAPSLQQLTRWVILSLKWPDLVRWLQWSPGVDRKAKHPGENITLAGYRLGMLEEISLESKDQEQWEKYAAHQSGLPEKFGWIADERLREFFKEEIKLPPEERLSSAAGQGLY